MQKNMRKESILSAMLVKELVLELREDRALSAIADQRMEEAGKKSHKTVSHEKAWE
jgi:hypothetical protein